MMFHVKQLLESVHVRLSIDLEADDVVMIVAGLHALCERDLDLDAGAAARIASLSEKLGTAVWGVGHVADSVAQANGGPPTI
jgi:hypothetical protein